MALDIWLAAHSSIEVQGSVMALILASQSPRRRELLGTLGVEFTACSVDIDETPHEHESPEDYVHRLGLEKAREGLNQRGGAKDWVLGSDTTVVNEGRILGKPVSKTDFISMMQGLSGRTHQVLTSVALVSSNQAISETVRTDVTFIELTDQAIEHYWETGEPQDKAGGYGIQGLGSVFVRSIEGSYSNVVGLPLHETAKILSKAGLPIWNGRLLLTT
jgi:septum formation protein